jgi:hypothetical protein
MLTSLAYCSEEDKYILNAMDSMSWPNEPGVRGNEWNFDRSAKRELRAMNRPIKNRLDIIDTLYHSLKIYPFIFTGYSIVWPRPHEAMRWMIQCDISCTCLLERILVRPPPPCIPSFDLYRS